MTIPQGRLRRTAPLAAASARAAGGGLVSVLKRRLKGQRGAGLDFHVRNAQRYAELLSHSKGVLMKVGQIVSFVDTAPALDRQYGDVYRTALSSLQADADPMDPVLVGAVVESELGRPPEELFASFSPTPLAAASIGQVHAARLYDGTEVAVKVQYPGVADAIGADLANAELLLTFVKLAKGFAPQLRNVDVRPIAEELTERISEELDYRRELANQAEFADHYRGHPFARVPTVFPELSSDRVLTMELARGRRWTEIADADQDLRNKWGEAIDRFFFGAIARFGIFNADPHPGNYLFHDDGTVTFLDFGCVKRLDDRARRGFWEMPLAALANDGEWLERVLVEQGFFPAAKPPPRDKMLAWIRGNFGSLDRPQPFTFTPEFAAETLAHLVSLDKDVMRYVNVARDFIFANRIYVGLYSILGALRATADWRAIFDEDVTGVPTTQLGRIEADFFARTSPAL
ncbi:MAG TPA: AarF/ABC1/UbiB kinase family protein [Acidimicrobiales bacterium]|nr:AarF/ABC1/UbiB kinase family protein [Acidimicrobiales bacterium]